MAQKLECTLACERPEFNPWNGMVPGTIGNNPPRHCAGNSLDLLGVAPKKKNAFLQLWQVGGDLNVCRQLFCSESGDGNKQQSVRGSDLSDL